MKPVSKILCQFHQHFTRGIFVQNFGRKKKKFLTKNTAFIQNFGGKNALSYEKRAGKMLMKLTPCVLCFITSIFTICKK
jgi:hypothetical protein